MWLLPVFSPVARLAVRAFYRLTVSGEPVPDSGPVLLVANHPNSLLDPGLVVALAGRPVRFLAKAPLFTDPLVGWLVRGAGAIPVVRRQDDEGRMGQNADTFRAAHAALRSGDAVGVFPEGLSHSSPALQPLKTGAARIALGAVPPGGSAFPVVPVGLSFRRRERFRSSALAVVGRPIEWGDLAGRGEDPEAVRELTARVQEGLLEVTVNLERWEDAPLVEAAERIYAAEMGLDLSPPERVRAQREVSEGLARLRAGDRGDWKALAREVERHGRMLRALRLRPHQLAQPTAGAAARWALREALILFPALPIALLGACVYYLPYRLTGLVEARARPEADVRATYKVLAGAALHLVWTLALAAALLAWAGPLAALAALLGLPALGAVAIWFLDRLGAAEGALRRFLVRGRRAALIPELRARQREIADRLARLRTAVRA